MLTATYSLVVIATEQRDIRADLCGLEQSMQSGWGASKHRNPTQTAVRVMCDAIDQFDQAFWVRKFETCVIPVIRTFSETVSALLSEISNRSARLQWNAFNH